MDTDGHSPSTSNKDSSDIPISVIVSSDTEPVETNGLLRRFDGGFCMSFTAFGIEYELRHDGESTAFSARGEHSYAVTLCDKPTGTVIDTPYGSLEMTVITTLRNVTETEHGIDIDLKYALGSQDSGMLPRDVNIKARYKGTL